MLSSQRSLTKYFYHRSSQLCHTNSQILIVKLMVLISCGTSKILMWHTDRQRKESWKTLPVFEGSMLGIVLYCNTTSVLKDIWVYRFVEKNRKTSPRRWERREADLKCFGSLQLQHCSPFDRWSPTTSPPLDDKRSNRRANHYRRTHSFPCSPPRTEQRDSARKESSVRIPTFQTTVDPVIYSAIITKAIILLASPPSQNVIWLPFSTTPCWCFPKHWRSFSVGFRFVWKPQALCAKVLDERWKFTSTSGLDQHGVNQCHLLPGRIPRGKGVLGGGSETYSGDWHGLFLCRQKDGRISQVWSTGETTWIVAMG